MLAKLVPDRPGTNLNRMLFAPMTKKDGEKSLQEKEDLNPEDLENVKKLREIYNGQDMQAKYSKKLRGLKARSGTPACTQPVLSLPPMT